MQRLAAAALVSALGAAEACTNDFGVFQPEVDGAGPLETDAASSDATAGDALAPADAGAPDITAQESGLGEGDATCSAPSACLADATSCAQECTRQYQSCLDACRSNDHGCRNACNARVQPCRTICTQECEACIGMACDAQTACSTGARDS